MKLDAVIFDMDGTITDTEKYYNRTWPLAFADVYKRQPLACPNSWDWIL